jgi:hypothetical protein
MEHVLHEHALKSPSENVRLVASAHGTDACLMGAVALVLDDILREPATSVVFR